MSFLLISHAPNIFLNIFTSHKDHAQLKMKYIELPRSSKKPHDFEQVSLQSLIFELLLNPLQKDIHLIIIRQV